MFDVAADLLYTFMSACAILVRLVFVELCECQRVVRSTNGTFITTLYNSICTMTYFISICYVACRWCSENEHMVLLCCA